MPGLVPSIHVLDIQQDMDGRDKPDEAYAIDEEQEKLAV